MKSPSRDSDRSRLARRGRRRRDDGLPGPLRTISSELSRPPLDREEVKARVEYLFPRTETNWTVGSRSPRRAAG